MLVFKSTNTVKISTREIMTNMREEGRYRNNNERIDKHQLQLREQERNTEAEGQGILIYIDRGKREIYIDIDRGGRIIYIYLHYRVPL